MKCTAAVFVVAWFASMTTSAQTPDADKPLEQTKKNIRVLTGVPTSQLIPIMTVMTNSIGVTCNYCHTPGDFASDEKPQKEAGRRMIRLVRAINDAHYGGRPVVTCNTCHHGEVATADVPSIDDAGYNKVAPSSVAPPLPAADEIFARYLKAWGDTSSIKNRLSRGVATAVSGRGDPKSAPFELYQALPDTIERKLDLPYPPEANREFVYQFFGALRIRERYASLRTIGIETVDGRDAYVVEALPKDGSRAERLLFDVSRGVLLRRVRETATIVGPLPERYDFADYRTVDGVLVPFLMQWSRGDYQVTHRFADVKHNVTR